MKNVEFMEKEKTKQLLLYLFRQLNAICEKYDIPYYGYAGTILGAVRHKGLIPWDDDMDVVIERKYYNRFVEACSKELTGPVTIHTRENDRYFCQEYIKLCFREDDGGFSDISIDVFIMDETDPQKKILRSFQNIVLESLYFIKYYKVTHIQGERTYTPQNGLKHALLAMGSLMPIDMIDKLHKKIMTLEAGDMTHFVIWGSHYSYQKVTFEKNMWSGRVYLPFETVEIPVPEHYLEILRQMYGADYMKLPPKEKQINHGVRELNCKMVDNEWIGRNC